MSYLDDVLAMTGRMRSDLRKMRAQTESQAAAPSEELRKHVAGVYWQLVGLGEALARAETAALHVEDAAHLPRGDAPKTGNVAPPGYETGLPVDYRNEHLGEGGDGSGVPLTDEERKQRAQIGRDAPPTQATVDEEKSG
jgi:hypothetical protein